MPHTKSALTAADKGTPLGDHFYMFSPSRGTAKALISAHGGYYTSHGQVTAPCNIHFFAPDGFTLQDPGVAATLSGLHIAETVKKGEKTRNYVLSKFQGRGQKDESYGVIRSAIDSHETMADTASTAAGQAFIEQQNIDPSLFEDHYHIVTVRNRLNPKLLKWHIHLSAALDAILAAQPGITDIYCSFCRPDMMKFRGVKNWNAKTGAQA